MIPRIKSLALFFPAGGKKGSSLSIYFPPHEHTRQNRTGAAQGGKERVQVFQGIVIAKRGSGVNEAFTVRKISYGEGVERSFPLHSPRIAKVDVVTRGKVRRAKLHYLRSRVGKEAVSVKTAR